MNEQSLLQTIFMIETRLQSVHKEETEGDTQEKENIQSVFPITTKCLYYYLLADAYLQLFQLYTSPPAVQANNQNDKTHTDKSKNATQQHRRSSKDGDKKSDQYYGMKCLETLEIGMKLIGDTLDPHEKLRVSMTYCYCKAICLIQQRYSFAKVIAEKFFFLANDYLLDISEESSKLLQRLRDDFMTYEKPKGPKKPKPLPILIPGKILTLEQSDALQKRLNPNEEDIDKEEEDEEEKKAKEELKVVEASFFKRRASSKVKEIHKIKKHRQFRLLEENQELLDEQQQHHSSYSQHVNNKKYRLATQIRRQISLPVPMFLESMTSAKQILKALDRIFRAYVRGNALPGQQSGGSTVDLAGSTLSFRTFVLQGPYLSWKGFISFLLDFSIAALPENNTKSGRNFYRSLNFHMAKDLLAQVEAANNPTEVTYRSPDRPPSTEAVLSMLEAAIVFIESSRSATPVLVINKYMKFYTELAESLETDPWNNVYDWTILDTSDGTNEWDIIYGINFTQFVDCVGKLGMIAYSTPLFHEMLPTNNDKIEHFFTAFLGLSDERKWLMKVENKLKKMRSLIKEVGSPASQK